MKIFFTRLIAFVLVAWLGLTSCSASGPLFSDTMTGDYPEDVAIVIDSLRTSINLPEGSKEKADAQAEARQYIYDFVAHYRRDPSVSGTTSYTSMQTALNSLAGHYNTYPNLPVPDELKARIERAFQLAEIAVQRGI